MRQRTKRAAGYLREDQAWSERHGRNRWMPATRFATPHFVFAAQMMLNADAG
jgi:hypothetical protein